MLVQPSLLAPTCFKSVQMQQDLCWFAEKNQTRTQAVLKLLLVLREPKSFDESKVQIEQIPSLVIEPHLRLVLKPQASLNRIQKTSLRMLCSRLALFASLKNMRTLQSLVLWARFCLSRSYSRCCTGVRTPSRTVVSPRHWNVGELRPRLQRNPAPF